jgi:tetratricopeptide (TPR) repeat protein
MTRRNAIFSWTSTAVLFGGMSLPATAEVPQQAPSCQGRQGCAVSPTCQVSEAIGPAKEAHEQACMLLAKFKWLMKEGRYEEAEACAMKAYMLDPDNPVAVSAYKTIKMRQHAMAAGRQDGDVEESSDGTDNPAAKQQKVVKVLVMKYHEACRSGRLDDARKLAIKALEIDPACFSKDR